MSVKVFLIDTENVSYHGFEGIRELDDTCLVHVLYSSAFLQTKIPTKNYLELMCSKTKFVTEQIEPKGKNYLDMQISTIVGFVMERHPSAEVVIISKDNDYIALIDYWTKHGRSIQKATSIQEYLHPSASSSVISPVAASIPDEELERYRLKIAEILETQCPDKTKASITKQSKTISKKKTKDELKQYCISAFADNQKNGFKVYSRLCQEFIY